MLTGQSPFHSPDLDDKKLWYKILRGEFVMPEYVPEEAKDLIRKLLEVDPKERLGAQGVDQIKSHSFFASVNWEEMLRNNKKGPLVVKYEKDEMRLRALNINFEDDASHQLEPTFKLHNFSFTEGYKVDEKV